MEFLKQQTYCADCGATPRTIRSHLFSGQLKPLASHRKSKSHQERTPFGNTTWTGTRMFSVPQRRRLTSFGRFFDIYLARTSLSLDQHRHQAFFHMNRHKFKPNTSFNLDAPSIKLYVDTTKDTGAQWQCKDTSSGHVRLKRLPWQGMAIAIVLTRISLDKSPKAYSYDHIQVKCIST